MNLMSTRSGEKDVKLPLRTDRFFAVYSAWYFTTREGAAIGPFESKQEAQSGLLDFIEFIQKAEGSIRNTFISSLVAASK
jgi:hypothetical protein